MTHELTLPCGPVTITRDDVLVHFVCACGKVKGAILRYDDVPEKADHLRFSLERRHAREAA